MIKKFAALGLAAALAFTPVLALAQAAAPDTTAPAADTTAPAADAKPMKPMKMKKSHKMKAHKMKAHKMKPKKMEEPKPDATPAPDAPKT